MHTHARHPGVVLLLLVVLASGALAACSDGSIGARARGGTAGPGDPSPTKASAEVRTIKTLTCLSRQRGPS